jgi:N-formylmaleamate deformylase
VSEDAVVPNADGLRGSSLFVEANGISHHLLEYGDAGSPTVLILPGITSPAATWEFVAEPLASEFHVLTLDIRGRGLSGHPSDGFTLPDYAADVDGVIRALRLVQPIVLGHSMGARIAAAYGALHAGDAGAFVIVDPPLTGPGRRPYSISEETFIRSIREAKAGANADDMRRYFPTWTEEQLELRAKWLATCDENAVAQTHRLFHEDDFFDYWPKLAVPAVFIYGSDSPAVTAEGVAEVAAALPSAEIRAVTGAGHMIPWDNRKGFAEALLPALRSLAARPPAHG